VEESRHVRSPRADAASDPRGPAGHPEGRRWKGRGWKVLVVVGAVLALSGVGLLASSWSTGFTSLDEIPAGVGWYVAFQVHVLSGGSLQVDFAVTSPGTVDLFTFTEAQYTTFRTTGTGTFLHGEADVSSGRFDVSLAEAGTYYVTMHHGPAYGEVAQNIRTTFRVLGLSPTWLISGLVILAPGVVFAAMGLSLRRRTVAAAVRPAKGRMPLGDDGPSSREPKPPFPPFPPRP
jgi:hypothetical protein